MKLLWYSIQNFLLSYSWKLFFNISFPKSVKEEWKHHLHLVTDWKNLVNQLEFWVWSFYSFSWNMYKSFESWPPHLFPEPISVGTSEKGVVELEHDLEQWSSNGELRASSISITWELNQKYKFWGATRPTNQNRSRATQSGVCPAPQGSLVQIKVSQPLTRSTSLDPWSSTRCSNVLENFCQEDYSTDHLEFMGPNKCCCWEIQVKFEFIPAVLCLALLNACNNCLSGNAM